MHKENAVKLFLPKISRKNKGSWLKKRISFEKHIYEDESFFRVQISPTNLTEKRLPIKVRNVNSF